MKDNFTAADVSAARALSGTRHALPQPAADPLFWGFSHYNIDGEALNIGKLILKEASGIFLTARRLTHRTTPAAAAADHPAGAPEPADLSGGTGTRAEQRRNYV